MSQDSYTIGTAINITNIVISKHLLDAPIIVKSLNLSFELTFPSTFIVVLKMKLTTIK